MSFIQNANAETVTPTAETAASTATASGSIRPGQAPEGDLLSMALPFIFIFVVFYFLIMRPQQKKFKEHHAMVSSIAKGDKVITSGGIIGKVTKVDADNVLHVEIAEGVTIKVVAGTISSVVAKDKPVNDNAATKEKPKAKAKKK